MPALPPRENVFRRRRRRPVAAKEAGRFGDEFPVLFGVDGAVPRGVEHREDEV